MLQGARYEQVVPEGSHEDLTCEGPGASAVQVKSRQGQAGQFRASELAHHLRKLHERRTARPHDGEPVLVIERDIDERPLPAEDVLVGDLEADHPLAVACVRVISSNGLPIDAFDDIRIQVISLSDARRRAAEIIVAEFGVEFPIAERIALEFKQLVCDAADHNAESSFADRSAIDRTGLVATAQRTIAETDPSKLSAAIDSGACEPADLDTPTNDPSYFEGLHAQPGHVAAGLPTWRPDLVETVLAGMSTTGAVLISGPSGVGKSTVMWMSAHAARQVTWFRVHRLRVDDVEDLCRLAEGRRPNASAPVGFLVDGVGLSDVAGWDQLVRRTAGMSHVYVVGTARVEDTFEIATLTQTARVDVTLDEQVAERIHENLVAAGLTTQAHWREAFNQANGLTLEYTYYLTRGERLRDVLGSQVQRLVRENADAELQLLALTTTAHMHGVPLPIEAAQAALTLSDSELRRAVSRLKDEHFVAEDSGVLSGLHLLRSRALSMAVHANPPPTFADTVKRLVAHVPAADLPRLVVGVLRDRDDADTAVIQGAAARVRAEEGGSGLLASVMHALRSADFLRHARRWAQIVLDEKVPPAHWPITVTMGLIDAELIKGMHPAIVAAVNRLRALSEEPTPLRDEFVSDVTADAVVDAVLAQTTPGRIATLLTACSGAPAELLEALRASNWTGTPAGDVLAGCSDDDFGNIASIGQSLLPGLAEQMVHAAGGEDALLDRIRGQYPQMYDVGRVTDRSTPVAMARLAYVDDELTPDCDRVAVDVARVLLRSMPECANADVKTVRSGGAEYAVGDLTIGSSGLLRRYAITNLEVEWNRARSILVLHELGFATQGEHAGHVAALLPRAVAYFERFLTLWVTERDTVGTWDWNWVDAERRLLAEEIDQLAVSQDGLQLFQETIPAMADRIEQLLNTADNSADRAAEGGLDGMKADDAHTVLSSVAYNTTDMVVERRFRQLPFHLGNVTKDLHDVATDEQWELAGLEAPPEELETLRRLLTEPAAIAAAISNGVITPRDVRREARSGPVSQAIQRAADACRTASRRHMRAILDTLDASLASAGVQAQVIERDTEPNEGYWPYTDFAVLVECTTVLEWTQLVEPVVEAVLAARSNHHLPSTLICPVIAGVREPELAMKVHSSAYHLNDRYYDWFPDEQPRDETVEDLPSDVQRALLAVARRSGLNYLATRRELSDDFQTAYDATPTQFGDALNRIRSYGDDACIDTICEELFALADLVDAETAEGDTPGKVASDYLDALASKESVIANTVIGLRLASIQWTHDVDAAVEMVS
jgi:hypothetical protein